MELWAWVFAGGSCSDRGGEMTGGGDSVVMRGARKGGRGAWDGGRRVRR